ncbi:small ribosomal subunit protein bS6m [Athene noctua]|uniref:small ribosomal subunit protein bS6m n=1 Tax=Athene noctua TaxID=126797 RepID=UPI003EBA0D18
MAACERTAGWETCAQKVPWQERPHIKASHLLVTHPCPSGGLQPPALVRQRLPEVQKVLEELSMPHMRDPGLPGHPRLALRPKGASAARCRCQPTQVRGDNGRGRRRGRRRGARAAGTVLPPPPPCAVSGVCVCARRGGARGRTQWKFPLPAAATAAAAAAAGRRKAGAGPGPLQGGKAAPAPQLGPPASGPLRGGKSPLPPFSPVTYPRPPRAGAAGQPPGGRRWPPGQAGGRAVAQRRRRLARAGGGAAEPAQLPAPFKPRRPPARPVSVQSGSRAGRSRRQHRLPPGTRLPPPVPPLRHRRCPPLPPPPPPSRPLSRRIPAPPATASSKMPRYELALILKAMQRPETAAVLKRTVEALMERGAVVRSLENLGERSLPYKISKHNERHRRGGYFLIDLEGPPSIVSTMMDHLGRDIDVIRRGFIKHPVSKTEECSGIIPVNYEDKLIVKKK